MQGFRDSSSLLGDADLLRQRFEQEGYLYLPGLVDEQPLRTLRDDIAALCAEAGWLKPGSAADNFEAWTMPAVEGEERYFEVYDRLQCLESFHSLPHHSALLQLMQALLGPTAFPHPLSVARLVFPDNADWATPPHQDYPNNQGTPDLFACWMPLHDCSLEQGALAIAPGSHRAGLLPLRFALGAGHRAIDEQQAPSFDFVSSPMRAGDVLVFHSHTVHRALPNHSSRMRVSVDYRYQREGEPLVAQSLQPHFARLDWPQVYANWQDSRLQYYWQELDCPLVEWDASLHAVPETMAEAVALRARYDAGRRRFARRFEAG